MAERKLELQDDPAEKPQSLSLAMIGLGIALWLLAMVVPVRRRKLH